jgi:hypothetical protein
MHRPFGNVCRLIPGTRMIDFNPAWIYRLAEGLTPLEALQANRSMGDFFRELTTARDTVDDFLNHRQHTLFPDTCEDLASLLEAIDAIAPPDAKLKHQTHILTMDEVVRITATTGQAGDTLERECTKKYIIGLEKQRALDPQTLIERIEDAFAPGCWNRLSSITKKECEECGKCLALERYTAAGFHVLRGVESELRNYVALLIGARPNKRDWGFYIETLKQNGANPKLIATLDNIRSLDRNPLMHPEDWLDQDEAIAIFNTAQTALNRLISDMEAKSLLPPRPVTAPPL